MSTRTEVMPAEAWLRIDAEAEVQAVAETMRGQLMDVLKRRGLVVAMSGGVDSSVAAGLAVRAVGPKRVFGVFMPEQDSDPRSLELAKEWADKLGIEYTTEDIAPTLAAAGCYERRDDAIRSVVPEYGPGWKSKIVLPGNRLDSDHLNTYSVVVQSPDGELTTHRLPPAAYRVIVAATNFKQRVRKMLEYYHADRLHYAVVGTPNRLEYDQGFFVKGGDGLADLKPIAHLYKTQVYQLAAHLGVPEGVTNRPPTTDTYSLPQSQEEFYFALPARMMDLVLFAHNHGKSADEAAAALGLTAEQVERAYRDIEQKRVTTEPLHVVSLLSKPVAEIHPHGRVNGGAQAVRN
ncbi:MAG TPA: NAD(+) synthase [Longimicrobiales bacterium]|nr:NAD(+) synthase [Longimicrobiales bacterium]